MMTRGSSGIMVNPLVTGSLPDFKRIDFPKFVDIFGEAQCKVQR